MSERYRPSLGQVFVLTLLGLGLLLGVLLYGVSSSSRRTIDDSAEALRRAAIAVIGQRVDAYLHGAERALDAFERRAALQVVDTADPASVEKELFAALADNPNAAGMRFIRAESLGFDERGERRLRHEGRWQIGVYRETADAESPLATVFLHRARAGYVVDARRRPTGGALLSAPFVRQPDTVKDPTLHATFVVAASRSHAEERRGRALWSDLYPFESDVRLPGPQRQIAVVTAQRAVVDGEGRFLGVVGTGVRTEAMDRIVREEAARARPHRLFLCDEEGRLITRPEPDDPLVEQTDQYQSLRVEPRSLSPEVARALRHPGIAALTPGHPDTAASFVLEGRPYLASFRLLPATQGWRVGVVVAEDELPGVAALVRRRNELLLGILLLSLAILAGGLLTLRTVERGLRQIDGVTASMADFDFRRAVLVSAFRDVDAVMGRLEQAKTALRALGKYVPVDLVRLLYKSGQEPVLGGRLHEVTLMFTDVRDFTTVAERLAPEELAALLGRYLEVMTAAIHAESGIVDKYIGDGIMALWNAPIPCPDHARRACAATLRAASAGEALCRSEEWAGRPPLVTRFGLHRDTVLVGHFGAPDRMSYTVLGDGVNLASRLEGLNKEYGTTILASEAVRAAAESAFDFRLVDVVAVKGKTRGVRIFELLGKKGAVEPRLEVARRYEEAFARYQRRDFSEALGMLEVLPDDGPARTLAERCRLYLVEAPPPGWDGTYVATRK